MDFEDKKKYLAKLAGDREARRAEESIQSQLDFQRQRKSLKDAPVDMAPSDLFDKDYSKVKSIGPKEVLNDIQEVSPIESWKSKIASKVKDPGYEKIANYSSIKEEAKQIAKKLGKGLKAVPVIGAAASLLGSQDASAAIPVLGDAEETGPIRGSLEHKLESGTITPEEREQLRIQALKNFRNGIK